MSGQNQSGVSLVNKENMAASYASVVSQPFENFNDNITDELHDDISQVKPVFILENDIFGNTKPKPEHYVTHTEIYKDINEIVPAIHLKGLQRVNGLWRIYLDDEDARATLLSTGLIVRKKRLTVYSRNPRVVARENPNFIRVRVKNVPLSADDGQIFRFLQVCRLVVHNYYRERLRVDSLLTNCQTGDRIFYCDPPVENIPRFVKIGKYNAQIIYKGQIVINPRLQCSKCLKPGHKQDHCQNDWVCRKCGKSGHKVKDCEKLLNDQQADDMAMDSNATDDDEQSGAETDSCEEDHTPQS